MIVPHRCEGNILHRHLSRASCRVPCFLTGSAQNSRVTQRRRANMDAVMEHDSLVPQMLEPRARIGLIIPSVNRMTEPQFNNYAPEGLGVLVARARVAGQPGKTVAELT